MPPPSKGHGQPEPASGAWSRIGASRPRQRRPARVVLEEAEEAGMLGVAVLGLLCASCRCWGPAAKRTSNKAREERHPNSIDLAADAASLKPGKPPHGPRPSRLGDRVVRDPHHLRGGYPREPRIHPCTGRKGCLRLVPTGAEQ